MTTAAWVQAVSTVVLVVVTGIYVRLTSQLSRAAQATARAAERGLLLDAAPIILPRRTVGSGVVTGSLHNIGGHLTGGRLPSATPPAGQPRPRTDRMSHLDTVKPSAHTEPAEHRHENTSTTHRYRLTRGP
jgi:hypothetical protein